MTRPETFEEFFDAQRDRLFRALCLITGSRHEAEEISQDAFLALWERWDRLGAVTDLPGYLHRSAINCFRKRYRRSRVMLRRLSGGPSTTEVFDAVDARVAVARALQDLAPRQRAAIVLTELLGFTADDGAKGEVTWILRDWFGWRNVIDLGDITTARGAEMSVPLWLILQVALGTVMMNHKLVM